MLSTASKQMMLQHLRNTYADMHLGLFVTNPFPSMPGIEVSGGGYTRRSIQLGSVTVSEQGNFVIMQNANPITFPQATADWGLIKAFAIFDAAQDGNYIGYVDIPVDINILTDSQLQVPQGDLVIMI